MPTAGSRRIVVDETTYRWRVGRRPTYAQALAWSPLAVSVEAQGGGNVLVILFPAARPDNWFGLPSRVATPGAVALAIAQAVGAGWDRDSKGGPTFFDLRNGILAASERELLVGSCGQRKSGVAARLVVRVKCFMRPARDSSVPSPLLQSDFAQRKPEWDEPPFWPCDQRQVS
jgi:hypothetical protein